MEERLVKGVLQSNTTVRLQVAEELLTFLSDPSSSLTGFEDLDQVVEGLVAWLGSSHFKFCSAHFSDLTLLCKNLNGFLSDEPGYYDDGSFGIRHENVVLIEEAATPHRYKNEQYLTMEPVTMVPYQQKMILPELLTPLEIEWLNEYHTKCWEQVGPLLREKGNMKAYQWLQNQTRLLG